MGGHFLTDYVLFLQDTISLSQQFEVFVHAFKIETKILLFGCAITDKSVYVLLNQMPKAIFKMKPVPYHA